MYTSEIVFIHNKLLKVSTTYVAIFRETIGVLTMILYLPFHTLDWFCHLNNCNIL